MSFEQYVPKVFWIILAHRYCTESAERPISGRIDTYYSQSTAGSRFHSLGGEQFGSDLGLQFRIQSLQADWVAVLSRVYFTGA